MTLYAHTTAGTIDQVGALPALWLGPTRWHDWRGDPETWATQPADWGWLPVVETPRPADTATHTSDPAPVALVAGVPTQQWTVRPWTAEELAARQQQANQQALTTDTTTDLSKVRDAIDKLAILLADNTTAGSIRAWKQPITNAQTLTGAQGKALADLLIDHAQATRKIARQVMRLAKLQVGDLGAADVGAE